MCAPMAEGALNFLNGSGLAFACITIRTVVQFGFG